jgi:hypothetical protein
MERAPGGSPVGVDDPYEFAGVCDHLTSDGRCRLALEFPDADPSFAADRRTADYDCLAAPEDVPDAAGPDHRWADWRECPHYRSTTDGRECVRCGIEEVRMADEDSRPLLEEHHLSYGGGDSPDHEITVSLCRWCHAKVHNSFARVDDDAAPDPEAVAARERRRGREMDEYGFTSARERRADPETGRDGHSGPSADP